MTDFQSPAEDCAATLDLEQELFGEARREKKLEWDGSTIKSVRTDRDLGVGFRVQSDDRTGFAYSNASKIKSDWLCEQAASNLRLQPADEHRTLSLAESLGDVCDDWLDETVETNISQRKDRISYENETLLTGEDALKNLQVEYGEGEHRFELFRNGKLVCGETRSFFTFSAWAICESNSDIQSGYQKQTSFRYDELTLDRVLSEAVEEGRRKLGAEPPKSRTGPVLLNPRAASGLLRLIRDMLDGESVARGRSAWGPETIGDSVADDSVTVLDNPSLPGGAANRTRDAEGYPLATIKLIDDGICQGFLTNQYVSDRLDLDNNHRASRSFSSLPGVSSTNFRLEAGTLSHSNLEESLDSGPVVTAIQPGSGLDPVAGQFSVGASGYFVDSGKRTNPFDEATLSGSVKELLSGINGIGNNPPRGYSIASPSLLVEELSLGGSQ